MQMSVDYSMIGKRIKQKRKQLHQTQDYLAEALGVSVGYVSQIERGVTKISLDTLSAISSFLQCDITELITGVTPTQSDYLNDELHAIYAEMSHHQKRLLLKIAGVLLRQQEK